MRLNWRRSSRAEDQLEKWFLERYQEHVLAGDTAPPGPHPDEGFLRDLARKSKRIALSDPRIEHVSNCRQCMSRLLALRQEVKSRRRRMGLAVASVSCLAAIVVVVLIARGGGFRTQPPANNMAVVARTVNLWDAAALRGTQPGALQAVSLPATRVRVTVILPRFSSPGQYLVAVTRTQNGEGLIAESQAASAMSRDQERVSVDLDLRNAKEGEYFLSTTHEQDQASYYYPLQIR
jgi:hypothetical protein